MVKIKKIFITLLVFLTVNGSSVNAFQSPYKDHVLLLDIENEIDIPYWGELFNHTISSLAYGIMSNETLNGSGTHAENYLDQKRGEGPIQQFLRILAETDLYFYSGIKKLKRKANGVQNFSWRLFPKEDFVVFGSYKPWENYFPLPFQKGLSALKHITQNHLPEIFVSYGKGDELSLNLQNQTHHHLAKKLKLMWEEGLEKQTFLSVSPLFFPISSNGRFRLGRSSKPILNWNLYIPLNMGLTRKLLWGDFSSPLGFRFDLPKPLITNLATFKSIQLLDFGGGDSFKEIVLKKSLVHMQFQRDFSIPSGASLKFRFGRLNGVNEVIPTENIEESWWDWALEWLFPPDGFIPKEFISLDTSSQNSTIYFNGEINLRQFPKFNSFLPKEMNILAFPHELHFDLSWGSYSGKKNLNKLDFKELFRENLTFIPQLNLKKSLISYKITISVPKLFYDLNVYSAAGFYCYTKVRDEKYLCTKKLGTNRDFNKKFVGTLESILTEKALRYLTNFNVPQVLDELQSPERLQEILGVIGEYFGTLWGKMKNRVQSPDDLLREFLLDSPDTDEL